LPYSSNLFYFFKVYDTLLLPMAAGYGSGNTLPPERAIPSGDYLWILNNFGYQFDFINIVWHDFPMTKLNCLSRGDSYS
jgi:hypothetical protein